VRRLSLKEYVRPTKRNAILFGGRRKPCHVLFDGYRHLIGV
jgi:hypothetical protein